MYSSFLLWQIPTSASFVQVESRLPEIFPEAFDLVQVLVRLGDDTDFVAA